MKIKITEILYRPHGVCCVLTAGLFLLGGTHSVRANWTASDVIHAWAGYNNMFLYNDNGYEYHFSDAIGTHVVVSTPSPTFWQQAEKIDLADDAYYWAANNDSANLANYKQEVQGLCDGFIENWGDSWGGDTDFDDDLAWASVAFLRAYQITGTTRFLTDGKNAFDTIWSRGDDSAHGGIWWNYKHTTPGDSNAQKNCAANFTFVIAGYYVYTITADNNELNRANNIYSWVKPRLYNSSTGKVIDGEYADGTFNTAQWSYNYGTCIGAAVFEHDSSVVGNAAVYLAYGLANGGYLPNYGQGADDNNGGFNGIAMRWLGFAIGSGYTSVMGTGVVNWAKANVTQAWSIRNSQELMWDNWTSATPAPNYNSPYVFSWDCSSAMAGMFDIPMQ